MTDNTMPGEVKVEQTDRDDAASYCRAMCLITGYEKDQILRGKWDALETVQWFARRRSALTQQEKTDEG